MSSRTRLAVLGGALVAAGVTVAVFAPHSAHELRDRFEHLGAFGPLVFLAVSIPLVSAFFPGWLVTVAAGLLFGALGGAAVGLAGSVGSASLSFAIGRHGGGRAAQDLAGPRALAIQERMQTRPFRTVLVLRLLPLMPFTVINYTAGLSTISYGPFALATVIGVAPRTILYAAAGHTFFG